MITMDFKNKNNIILVIGKTEGHLAQSVFAREILSEKKGPPPEINLFNEKNNGESVSKIISESLVESCHDVSLGGILIAISKMCIMGKKGAKLNNIKGLTNKFDYFFGEDQGRYIVEVQKENLNKVNKILDENSVHYEEIGEVTEENLTYNDELKISIEVLNDAYTKWLPNYMDN